MPIDYSKYPPNWKTEIRPRILDRAIHRCEICFVRNKEIGYWNRDQFISHGRLISDYLYYRIEQRYDKKTSLRLASTNRYKLIEIVLTVMHLDQDPENWEVKDDRLKAACQRCHLAYDKEDNQNKKKYGKDYKRNQIALSVGTSESTITNPPPHPPKEIRRSKFLFFELFFLKKAAVKDRSSNNKYFKQKNAEWTLAKSAPTVPTVPTDKHRFFKVLYINYLYLLNLNKIVVKVLERVGTCWNAGSLLEQFQQKHSGSNGSLTRSNSQLFKNQVIICFVGSVGTVGLVNVPIPFIKKYFL